MGEFSKYVAQGGFKYEPKVDKPDFGFKPGPKADFADDYDAWFNSERKPDDNVKFLTAIQPVLDSAVRSYSDSDDVVIRARAKKLALQAAPNWNREKSNLRTYMLNQLKPLHRLAAQRRHVINIPEALQYDLTRYRESMANLRDEYDRDPTDLELAEHLHMPLARIRRLRENAAGQINTGVFVDNGRLLASLEEHAIVDEYDQDSDPWVSAVYHDMTPTDRYIFERRSGFNGREKERVEDVARALGISAGRVSQRAKVIDERIRDRPEGW